MFFVESDPHANNIREELRRAGFNVSPFLHANVTACVTDDTPQRRLHLQSESLSPRQQRVATTLPLALLPTTTCEVAQRLGVRTISTARLQKWLHTRMLAPSDISGLAQKNSSEHKRVAQTLNCVGPASYSPTKPCTHRNLQPGSTLGPRGLEALFEDTETPVRAKREPTKIRSIICERCGCLISSAKRVRNGSHRTVFDHPDTQHAQRMSFAYKVDECKEDEQHPNYKRQK